MMAKLIRALELYYPMIQFLIKEDIPRGALWRIVHSSLTCGASFSGARFTKPSEARLYLNYSLITARHREEVIKR